MSKTRIKTPLGTVHENEKGYYRLSDKRLLHRAIWEEYYGQKVPEGYVLHHIDHNPKNNSIKNLQLMTAEDHLTHHHKDKILDESVKEKISKETNTVGYYRVNIKPCPHCKQGFVYRYQYIDELRKRRAITSTSLKELMIKVQGRNLPWFKIEKDEE